MGIVCAAFVPPIAEIVWIRANYSGALESEVPCLLVGLAFLWITPFKITEKFMLTIPYLAGMALLLFVVGASLVCGLYHSCL